MFIASAASVSRAAGFLIFWPRQRHQRPKRCARSCVDKSRSVSYVVSTQSARLITSRSSCGAPPSSTSLPRGRPRLIRWRRRASPCPWASSGRPRPASRRCMSCSSLQFLMSPVGATTSIGLPVCSARFFTHERNAKASSVLPSPMSSASSAPPLPRSQHSLSHRRPSFWWCNSVVSRSGSVSAMTASLLGSPPRRNSIVSRLSMTRRTVPRASFDGSVPGGVVPR